MYFAPQSLKWLVAIALSTCVDPSFAITNGELDGEGHPHVGLVLFKDATGSPLWRCSGTLLSSKVFLTAGHCVENPAASATIWFDADVENGIPENGYDIENLSFQGQVDSKKRGGLHAHPNYYNEPWFVNDVGIIELAKPYELDTYGELIEVNKLDDLVQEMPKSQVTFTAVGYGLQEIHPIFMESDRIRQVSHPHLVQINTGLVGDYSVLNSNNHATGGTCFGDSGGPNFLFDSNIIACVTSFGLNGECAGTGGVYRLDRDDDLAFIESFL